MKKQIVTTGSPWEDIVGYSRAVRIGDTVEVAGTTAMDKDQVIGEGDMYKQARFILEKIERALLEVGATMNDVIRTRMFVTDISKWEDAGKAHGEFFKDVKPVATMVQVDKLIDDRLWIEIEVSAVIKD